MTIRTDYGRRYNVEDLITEVSRRREAAVDVVTDVRNMNFVTHEEDNGENIMLLHTTVPGDMFVTDVNAHALGQMATSTKVGARYARMLAQEDPHLLAHNFNRRFHMNPKKVTLRNLDETTRALLSDSYKPIDDLIALRGMQAGMAVNGDWRIHEACFTEKRLHVRMVLPTVTEQIKLNDEVSLGIRISNSEVGAGSINVALELMRLVCLNGMVIPMKGLRKIHLGSRRGEDVIRLSDKAMAAGDRATMLEIMDVIKHLADPDNFRDIVQKMTIATEIELDDPPAAAVVMSKAAKLSDDEEAQMMRELFKMHDPTVWGLTNALTATARDMTNYDRKVELEEFAGKTVMAGPKSWGSLVAARA